VKTPLRVRLRRLLFTPMRWEAQRQVARWRRGVWRTRETQARVLARLMAYFAPTDFGRDFHFDGARTADDLRARMPVGGYERAAPYIARVARGETGALFPAGTRLRMFAMTSGTTGRAKYIPITDRVFRAYREGWHIWGAQALADHFDAFGTKLLQISSRMDEEITPSGLPAGAISGLAASGQRCIVRHLYICSDEVLHARDTQSKYYLLCRLGLACRRVMPVTANPSTLLSLARTMDRHKDDLLRDVADGTLASDVAIAPDVRRSIADRLRPNPRRSRDLERAVATTGHLYPRQVWDVPLIGTWKGGTLSLYLREMPRYWGNAPMRDIGLIASEGRFSVPVQSEGSAGILETTGTFYEFVPEEAIHDDDPPTLLAHEVEVGSRYFLVVTTTGGLFRYNMGDLVDVVDRFGEAPIIEFLNKGEHASNLTGEKLTEHQVVTAVNRSVAILGLRVDSYCLCPTWDTVPYYTLLVEEGDVPPEVASDVALTVDAALSRLNMEYEGKRQSGRLKPVRVKALAAGTWERYDRQLVESRRGRVEQYKHKFLEPEIDFEQRFPVLHEYAPCD